MRNSKTVGAVYIYIYIEDLSKNNLCKYSKETMYFRRN